MTSKAPEAKLDALKQAVASAKCDHDLEPLLHWREGDIVTIRERCKKCRVTFNMTVECKRP